MTIMFIKYRPQDIMTGLNYVVLYQLKSLLSLFLVIIGVKYYISNKVNIVNKTKI